ncbi:hypothetical protein GQ43DRAFT_424539 [Delitschia confertaspora ATCC 74209]|uniref:COP9 signalosome complex subunit 6 n=1 Tax=Delitschia confertaspora ATCC 74209 TaxID=1513339 RepID=A0A9P4MNZ3_9PLEO|nr:hypothetical protein GQ43DRAFT_424539 [Delitschia confertaspora ATCC 74209]
MAAEDVNPLISMSRASDTSPAIQLHPLVLLTISDCITRHQARQMAGPVVGAVMGQQNGQEVTMEVAFQAKLKEDKSGDMLLDDEWFSKRVEDYRDVYKQPQLELVGWFTTGPPSGPLPFQLPIHMRLAEVYTETPILCVFHPSQVYTDATAAGKLPLTLYESVLENATGGPNDKAMDIDGAAQAKTLKFRELVYTVETGEAEMIAVDFVARGGGNATEGAASELVQTETKLPDKQNKKGKGKTKEKEKHKEDTVVDESNALTVDDEELLASLTAKSNAIKMLSRRLDLIRTYLASLPPSYLSDPSLPFTTPSTETEDSLPLNHPILRSISALLARTNILAPADTAQFELESQQEASDVQLIALLASMQNSVHVAKEAGRKHHIIELSKAQSKKGILGLPGYDTSSPYGTAAFDVGHSRGELWG